MLSKEPILANFFKKNNLSVVTIMDKSTTRYNVQLYIYDLSKGMARSLSPIMLGKYKRQSKAVWPVGTNK